MYEIKEVSFRESYHEIKELIKEHWDELAKNKELMVLSPDWERYCAIEDAGNLLSLFVYQDGNCIGYSINIISNHLHYMDLQIAYNDVILLKKKYRNSPVGLRLIKQTKEKVRERGCRLLLWHVKKDTTMDKLLPKLGCKLQEVVYSEEL